MSLNGALQIGRSAITASQAAMQVAGNNMANAATPGYHRVSVHMSPLRGELLASNQFVGRGVELGAIRREVDLALQSRHRFAISQQNSAQIDQRFLTALENIQNELTDNDLSSELSRFFNAFSELANNPEDNAVRSLVVQQGGNLANRMATMRAEYNTVISEIDQAIGDTMRRVNNILDQLETVNEQIVVIEPVSGEAAALRDQRDILIDELSEYLDLTTVEQSSGSVDILVDSVPIFLAGQSRGVEFRQDTTENGVSASIRVAADGTELNVREGRLGGLIRQREDAVTPAIDDLDTFARQLIFQVNRLHSQGQSRTALTSIVGTYDVQDPAANLNAIGSGLPFAVENGSFQVHITHALSGQRNTYQINVDGDAMSLNDLIVSLNASVPNLTAGTGIANELTLDAAPGYEISFSDDTSGVLAALGINTFFTGEDAASIDVHEQLVSDPNRLAADGGHLAGSGGTASGIAGLQDSAIDALGGSSLREFWQNSVGSLAVKASAANQAVDSTTLVRESLNAQIQSVSGVSLDEESINLLTFQRQFQAAARFIGVIDETLQTLLTIA